MVHCREIVAFGEMCYALAPNHPHLALSRYTLGQLLSETASTATELRDGIEMLTVALASLVISGGEGSDLARGARELVVAQMGRLASAIE